MTDDRVRELMEAKGFRREKLMSGNICYSRYDGLTGAHYYVGVTPSGSAWLSSVRLKAEVDSWHRMNIDFQNPIAAATYVLRYTRRHFDRGVKL